MTFQPGLIDRLPTVRGSYRENASIAELTWFRVGGEAEVLFKPKDPEDLAHFVRNKPADVPIMIIGVGSNMLVRDGGIRGVVIRLPASFGQIRVDPDTHTISAGAFALDAMVAKTAAKHGIGGLAFLAGIPGTIGGALRMNAGAHGGETKDYLVRGKAITPGGELVTLEAPEFQHSYRHCGLPADYIFVEATFRGTQSDPTTELAAIQAVQDQREATQPIKSRTGGSTFKNPPGGSAWKCVDAAGMRGFQVGDAQMSPMHCNFMINTGSATAYQLETLGESVRRKVHETQGILLEWEIKRIGQFERDKVVQTFRP